MLDLELEDISGFKVAAAVRATGCVPRILATSHSCDHYTLVRAWRERFDGFVDKTQDGCAAILDALEALRQNRRCSVDYPGICHHRDALDPAAFTKFLSSTEERILRMIGHGLTDCEIAERIGVSERTTRNHRRHLLQKLGLQSSLKLIVYAVGHGFSRPVGPRYSR